MDDQVLDLFLTSFLGGAIGGGAVILIAYNCYRHMYIRYCEVKERFVDTIDVKKLQKDVESLQLQVVALQAQQGFIE